MILGSSYSSGLFDPAKLHRNVIQWAQQLTDWQNVHGRIGALAVRGSSGLGAAMPLSFFTGVPVIYVRKPLEKEPTHGRPVEGPFEVNPKTFLIFDDTIATGDTVRAIHQTLNDVYGMTCRGIILWQHFPSWNNTPGEPDRTYSLPGGPVPVWHWQQKED